VNAQIFFCLRASNAAHLGIVRSPHLGGFPEITRVALRRSTMFGWMPPRRRPISSAGSTPACRPCRREVVGEADGLFARRSRKDGSLPGICGYWFLIVDDHHHRCSVLFWYCLIMMFSINFPPKKQYVSSCYLCIKNS
jgi:hypothetical protein